MMTLQVYLAFGVGLFVGVCSGMLILDLCQMAKQSKQGRTYE